MPTPFDTIYALATPRAPAPRAVLRLSGAAAFELVSRLAGEALPRERAARTSTLGLDPALPAARVPVRLLGFPAPRSYTGEDVVEIHLVSAPLLLTMLEQRLEREGARLAWPGEFTRRAFENGRMDLAQAESVRRRIAAEHDDELRVSEALDTGREAELARRVLDLAALLEAGLDFESSESLAVASEEWEPELARLRAAFALRAREYAAVQQRCARPRYLLLGPPNAGKTSLWNALCTSSRSGLVAADAGTTRDVRWADAGGFELGDSPGRLEFGGGPKGEELGLIRRELALCDGYLLVLPPGASEIPPELPPPLARVRTMLDRSSGASPRAASREIPVSARDGRGLDELCQFLRSLGKSASPTSIPHAGAWAAAAEALDRADAARAAGLGEECVSAELREAALALSVEDAGALPERVLDRIFAAHCLGK